MMQEESWKCRLWYSVTCRTTQNAKNNGRDEWIWSNSQGKVPANLQADRQRRATGIKNDSRGPGLAGGKRPGLHNWTTKSDLLYHGWKSVAGCREQTGGMSEQGLPTWQGKQTRYQEADAETMPPKQYVDVLICESINTGLSRGKPPETKFLLPAAGGKPQPAKDRGHPVE